MPANDEWAYTRLLRAPLLAASDIVALRCFKAGQPFASEWQSYTQALRDVTKQADSEKVEWPTAPKLPVGI